MIPLAALPAALPAANPAAHLPDPVRHAEDARARLLAEGLRLFSRQGYKKTSTRELAVAAKVNIASISYYFGDKAGLYRAVFAAANGPPEEHLALFAGSHLTLEQALQGFYAGFLEPLRQGDTARLCMKLHFREMLEPTGLWDTQLAHAVKPIHDALMALLRRHLGLRIADANDADDATDSDLHRLAICLAGLGVQMHVCLDVNEHLLPGISDGAEAIDRWSDRLVMFGLAMVQAEARRRGLVLAGDSL